MDQTDNYKRLLSQYLHERRQSTTLACAIVDANSPGKSTVSRCALDKCCAGKQVRG